MPKLSAGTKSFPVPSITEINEKLWRPVSSWFVDVPI